MTPQIYYKSDDPIEDRYRPEIVAQTEAMTIEHEWWFDPPKFFVSARFPQRLAGGSKLLRAAPFDALGIPIPDNAIPERDNALMGYLDLLRIVGLLQILSRDFDIRWTLYKDEFHVAVGGIENGVNSSALDQFLHGIRDRWKFAETEILDTDRHDELRKTFASSDNITLVPTDEPLPEEHEIPEDR